MSAPDDLRKAETYALRYALTGLAVHVAGMEFPAIMPSSRDDLLKMIEAILDQPPQSDGSYVERYTAICEGFDGFGGDTDEKFHAQVVALLREADAQQSDALREALRRILGWREADLPEGNRGARAIEYMEDIARAALAAQETGGDR